MSRKTNKYSLSEIFQHWMLVIAFLMLAVTGFTQANPMGDFSKYIISIFGNLANVISFHRITGKFYALFFLLHLIYMAIQFIRGYRGLLLTKVDFQRVSNVNESRFKLRHKLDYYAVVFGSFVMILTGMTMIVAEFAASIIGGTGISIAREIHFNEAIIATGVIIFWHLFYAHFNPEVMPINTEILIPKKRSKSIDTLNLL